MDRAGAPGRPEGAGRTARHHRADRRPVLGADRALARVDAGTCSVTASTRCRRSCARGSRARSSAGCSRRTRPATTSGGWGSRRARAGPNNWNPWINSNVLAAALLVEPDAARRAAARAQGAAQPRRVPRAAPRRRELRRRPGLLGPRRRQPVRDARTAAVGVGGPHRLLRQPGRRQHRPLHLPRPHRRQLVRRRGRQRREGRHRSRPGVPVRRGHRRSRLLRAWGRRARRKRHSTSKTGQSDARCSSLFGGRPCWPSAARLPRCRATSGCRSEDMQLMAARDREGSTDGLYRGRVGLAQRAEPQPQRRRQRDRLRGRRARARRRRAAHLHGADVQQQAVRHLGHAVRLPQPADRQRPDAEGRARVPREERRLSGAGASADAHDGHRAGVSGGGRHHGVDPDRATGARAAGRAVRRVRAERALARPVDEPDDAVRGVGDRARHAAAGLRADRREARTWSCSRGSTRRPAGQRWSASPSTTGRSPRRGAIT